MTEGQVRDHRKQQWQEICPACSAPVPPEAGSCPRCATPIVHVDALLESSIPKVSPETKLHRRKMNRVLLVDRFCFLILYAYVFAAQAAILTVTRHLGAEAWSDKVIVRLYWGMNLFLVFAVFALIWIDRQLWANWMARLKKENKEG